MSIKIAITIDTEEDLWNDFARKGNPVDNIAHIPHLQKLFDKYGAVPTYLVNYPVVAKRDSRRIIQDIYRAGRCEVGMHCHPWNTPPFEETINNHNSRLLNLPSDLLHRKLECLYDTIRNELGVAPLAFRAGRWGFGSTVAQSIHALGISIDTSITPFNNWNTEEGPDFYFAPPFPYSFSPQNILTPDPNGRLVEIPPTIGFFQRRFERCAKVRRLILGSALSKLHLIGFLDRVGILNLRWLSPELSTDQEMVRLAKAFFKNGATTLNMTFHSTSLLPGKSPFVRNEEQLVNFYGRIETFLKFVRDRGLDFSSLSAIAETYCERTEISVS